MLKLTRMSSKKKESSTASNGNLSRCIVSLQYGAAWCRVVQCGEVCCSVVECVAVYCSVSVEHYVSDNVCTCTHVSIHVYVYTNRERKTLFKTYLYNLEM